MKINSLIVGVLLLAFAHTGYAQTRDDPCREDYRSSWTKGEFKDSVLMATLADAMKDCETMSLLSDSAYRLIIIEEAYYKAINDSLKILVGVLEQGQSLREDMIAEQKSFIDFQKASLTKYDLLLTRSTTLVDDATKNTDRALTQIKFYKLLSVGGILVGTAGVLIGVGLAIK